jgi:hypothetical protein
MLKRSWLAAPFIVTVFLIFPERGIAGDLKLTLVIYDHAHLSERKLAEVESDASEIFRRAGVQLLWVEGFAYAAKRRDVLIPAREDPATLVVKLQPESEAARYGVRSACGGIGFASGAIIFVRKFDTRSNVSDITRIGYVIAHEIGHVLLGPNAHSIAGIMRGTLLQQDWENAAQGTLRFTQSQDQQIRTWIAERGSSGDAHWLSLAGLSAQPPATELKIEVDVYNYSAVSSERQARAEQEAARIFERIGVATTWLDCPLTSHEAVRKRACALPGAPTRFTLRLLSNSMADSLGVGGDIFGSALLEVFGVMANVYADRIRELAGGREFEVILGRVITHELGHLLLGKNAHSAAGIMHARWRDQDLGLSRQAAMTFLPVEAKRIRAHVLARTTGSSDQLF